MIEIKTKEGWSIRDEQGLLIYCDMLREIMAEEKVPFVLLSRCGWHCDFLGLTYAMDRSYYPGRRLGVISLRGREEVMAKLFNWRDFYDLKNESRILWQKAHVFRYYRDEDERLVDFTIRALVNIHHLERNHDGL